MKQEAVPQYAVEVLHPATVRLDQIQCLAKRDHLGFILINSAIQNVFINRNKNNEIFYISGEIGYVVNGRFYQKWIGFCLRMGNQLRKKSTSKLTAKRNK